MLTIIDITPYNNILNIPRDCYSGNLLLNSNSITKTNTNSNMYLIRFVVLW